VQEGFFYVVIAPYTAPLATMVYSAVDAVRPMGINIAVYPANTLAANVAATVTAQAGYTHANVAAAVTTAIQNFIAAVPLGSGLLWSQLYSVAWGVPGVASVTGLTLNAGTADIAGTANQAIINGTTVIS
jgi:phage-related baseplate assembly protein